MLYIFLKLMVLVAIFVKIGQHVIQTFSNNHAGQAAQEQLHANYATLYIIIGFVYIALYPFI